MKLLLTGANGFIGRALCARLIAEGWRVIAALRSGLGVHDLPDRVEPLVIGALDRHTCWRQALEGVDTLIHLAAQTTARSDADLRAMSEVNVAATEQLARQAVAAGVRRMIFLSSAKVYGESSPLGQPFTPADEPRPETPYARSKWQAEQSLRQIARDTALELVIVRPPLVYGPAAGGNFDRLLRALRLGVPLPFANVNNRRSLLFIDNLVDLLIHSMSDPAAVRQPLLPADGEDLSTAELLHRAGCALERPARLFPMPSSMLFGVTRLMGQQAAAQRLCGNLQIEMSQTCDLLGWQPPFSVDQGLAVSGRELRRNSAAEKKILRCMDILLATLGLLAGAPLILFLSVIGWHETGSAFFLQKRVGRYQQPFVIYKFRTMRPGTVATATHLADPAAVTRFGRFLRRTKLDELPQLLNVIRGEMSLVGPRPCLYSQLELIRRRREEGVFAVRPGITGTAQLKGIDMSQPELLAATDAQMINNLSVKVYLRCLLRTVFGQGAGDRVKD